MAIAEKYLREHYGEEVQNHHIYAIVSDGDLMEGIAAEAASLAGQLGLGRLIYLYDDNDISLDGPTSLSFDREDVDKRFEAYGWHVRDVRDANDMVAIEAAIEAAQKVEDKPSLIRVKSVIGYPSPNKSGSSKAHGAALGEDEVALDEGGHGLGPGQEVLRPRRGLRRRLDEGATAAAAHAAWHERFAAWRTANPELAEEWDLAWVGKAAARPGRRAARDRLERQDKIATRSAGAKVMAAFEAFTPTMVGGAADLSESTKTEFPESERFTAEKSGRNVFFGVREHGMGGAVNGMAAHGGIVRPYGSTFLQFADYMRGAIRLSALMGLPSAWVYTHDSVALGEDGPTHQPVEHLAALRAIPGLVVLRPGDAHETAEAWRVILEDLEGPVALVLSRQDLPVLDREKYGSAAGVGKGAYVLLDADDARGDHHRDRQRGLGRARGGRGARRAGARRLDAIVGALRAAGRRLPDRRSCRSTCRRSPSRPASAWAGSATPTRSSRSTASAPRPRATRCSRSSASRRRTSPSTCASCSPDEMATGSSTAASRAASPDTVTWIAAGSRTHAIRSCDCRRSSKNSNASACARERRCAGCRTPSRSCAASSSASPRGCVTAARAGSAGRAPCSSRPAARRRRSP